MIKNITSKYSDISFVNIYNKYEIADIEKTNKAEIGHDWFHCCMSNDNVIIYSIKNKEITIGYISIYNIDITNGNADIYGYVTEKKYFGDLLKSIISVMYYVFDIMKLGKVSFKYREDNYFFDDIMRHLSFIKEGILRDQFKYNGKHYDVLTYSILAYEFRKLAMSDYRQMYTWDYNYTPNRYSQIDIAEMMNNRAFTNNIDNPHRVTMNDLGEFVLNNNIPKTHSLSYKGIDFSVNIFNNSLPYDNIRCRGQEINIQEDHYSELLIITMAQFGYQKSYIKLVYSDDSSEDIEFNVSDWCEKVLRDEYIISYTYGCRNISDNVNIVKCDSFLYLKKLKIDSNKKLKNIILPNSRDIYIFAINVCIN